MISFNREWKFYQEMSEKIVDLGFVSCQRKRQFQNKTIATKISECYMNLFFKKNLSVTLYIFYQSKEWSGADSDVRLRCV